MLLLNIFKTYFELRQSSLRGVGFERDESLANRSQIRVRFAMVQSGKRTMYSLYV